MRVDRANRTGLALIGLLLLAAGVFTLLRGFGAFGERSDSIATADFESWLVRNADWLSPAGVAAAVLVAALGVWWLATQVVPGQVGAGQLPVETTSRGPIDVDGHAAVEAVAAEIAHLPGVRAADVHFRGNDRSPRVEIELECAGSDVRSLQRRIEGVTIPRLERALGRDRLDVVTTLRLDPRHRAVE